MDTQTSLEQKARELLPQINRQMRDLRSNEQFIPTEFYADSIEIKQINKNEPNSILANIAVYVKKRNAKCSKTGVDVKFNSIGSYWGISFFPMIHEKQLPYFQRAILCMQLIQDIKKAYPSNAGATFFLEELCDTYTLLEKEKPVTDKFEFPAYHITGVLDIDKNKTIVITNLLKSIFLDEREQINEHYLQGKFEKDIPYEYKKIRKLEFK